MTTPSDLTALAVVVVAALACGIAMRRLGQPAIVGYIVAGVLLGPSVLSLVEDRDQIAFLADLGVLMLLFFVGMELNLRDFKAVWRIAVATTLLQVLGSVVVMQVLARLFGWSPGVALLFGFVMALSSTAVGVKMLEETNIVRQPVGQLTLGVLIAQDLAVVPLVLTVSALGSGEPSLVAALEVVVSIALVVLVIRYLITRPPRVLPFARMVGGHKDLLPLAGLVYCFGAATITGFLGLSPAFGAFLAGLYIGNSTGRRALIMNTHPIQAVLLMVFFLSIGLLFDLGYLWDNLKVVISLLLFVTVLKTAINMGAFHLLREPWPHAFIAGLMLAQIGEFSFVLGVEGVSSGVIGADENKLIVAVTALSLLLSPLWQLLVRRLLRIALASITSLRVTFRLLAGRRGIRTLARARQGVRRLAAALHRRRRPSAAAPEAPPTSSSPASEQSPAEADGGAEAKT